MAETSNIAELANIVFNELFTVFGWQRAGGKDRNFKCVLPAAHNKVTHPADLVCWYEDPYTPRRIYVNVDLKSYKAASITKATIGGALRSLAHTVECANASDEWRKAYVVPGAAYRTDGLLFTYNHSNDYPEGDFDSLLSSILEKPLALSKDRRICVMSPGDINYLYNVAKDILYHHGQHLCSHVFVHHDLIRVTARRHESSSTTIEALLAPWLLVRLQKPDAGGKSKRLRARRHLLLYYRGKGADFEEFAFLIDYLFRYQLLDDETFVEIRLPNGVSTSREVWSLAVEFYANKFHGIEDIKKRLGLDRVYCATTPTIVSRLYDKEVGMSP